MAKNKKQYPAAAAASGKAAAASKKPAKVAAVVTPQQGQTTPKATIVTAVNDCDKLKRNGSLVGTADGGGGNSCRHTIAETRLGSSCGKDNPSCHLLHHGQNGQAVIAIGQAVTEHEVSKQAVYISSMIRLQ